MGTACKLQMTVRLSQQPHSQYPPRRAHGTLQPVWMKVSYLAKANVNYIHLMPFLDTVPERSDGGYAVAVFRKVRPDLGTMEDLEALTESCHETGMNV